MNAVQLSLEGLVDPQTLDLMNLYRLIFLVDLTLKILAYGPKSNIFNVAIKNKNFIRFLQIQSEYHRSMFCRICTIGPSFGSVGRVRWTQQQFFLHLFPFLSLPLGLPNFSIISTPGIS